MTRNPKYESFGAGRAGQGQIDLRNGNVEFIHVDTGADGGILPSISHVYSTMAERKVSLDDTTCSCTPANGAVFSSVFGKGFRLNIQQHLRKVSDDPNDTRYILTDAGGKEHRFKELYYYSDTEGKRIYHKTVNGERSRLVPGDITVTHDGKLTYEEIVEDNAGKGKTHKIFTDLRTDSGLTLTKELKGFRNSELIETRSEELIQTEENIKELNRSIEDLDYSIKQYKKFQNQQILATMEREMQKKSLNAEKENRRLSKEERITDAEKRVRNANRSYDLIVRKDEYENIGRLCVDGGGVDEERLIGEISGRNIPAHDFSFETNGKRYTYTDDTGREIERLSMLSAYSEDYGMDHYGSTSEFAYDVLGYPVLKTKESADAADESKPVTDEVMRGRKITRLIQYLQERYNERMDKAAQEIRASTLALEDISKENQEFMRTLTDELLDLQIAFRTAKDTYDIDEEIDSGARYLMLLERAETDRTAAVKMLSYQKFLLTQYKQQIPSALVTNGGVTYGFNVYGNISAIWDEYDNHAALFYEEDNIIRIVDAEDREIAFEYIDGKLRSITDTRDRRTSYIYEGDRLVRIKYMNGECSDFIYGEGEMSIIPPDGMGARLVFDEKYRPIKLIAISSKEMINADEFEDNGPILTEDVMTFSYNDTETSTEVTDARTNYSTVYMFNNRGDCVTEYTHLGYNLKNIATYDTGHRECNFTMQRTEFDDDQMKGIDGEMTTSSSNSRMEPNGDMTLFGSDVNQFSENFAVWNLDVEKFPEHATDFILSGFAIADSDEICDRRRTEYCEESGHEHHLHCQDPEAEVRRFELRAEVVYLEGNRTKTFIASYDWKTKTRQFAAIPITFDEDECGMPIRPDIVRIYADYSYNNKNICHFSKPSLTDGEWVYSEMDAQGRRTFTCGNHRVTDRTLDGIRVGRFLTYSKTSFEYDNRGNLTKETTNVERTDGNERTERRYVTTYEYNKQSRPIRITAPNGMVSETEYDRKGNPIRSLTYHKNNPSSMFVNETERAENGLVTAEYDGSGENRTIIKYRNGTSIPIGNIAPDGQEFSMGSDPYTDELLAISSNVNGETNETVFGYTKGYLTRMRSGGTSYDYEYDGWGRALNIDIAGSSHVRFAYRRDDENKENADECGGRNSDGNDIATATYANGESYETVTDRFGKLLTVTRIQNGVRMPFTSNKYDDRGRIIAYTDHITGKTTRYIYNEDGSLNKETDGNVTVISDRNFEGYVGNIRYTVKETADDDGTTQDYTYGALLNTISDQMYVNGYDEEGRIISINLPTGDSETIMYDGFGRVTQLKHPAHEERIHYHQRGSNATKLITNVYHNDNRTRYQYDTRGNVTAIIENGRLTTRYAYDGIGRLIREDNKRLKKTCTYDYDTNGNIRFRNTYSFTLDELDGTSTCTGGFNPCCHDTSCNPNGSEVYEHVYCYAKEGNLDRMTDFNGERCIYDELGNPRIYRNRDLVWNNLGDLVRYGGISSEDPEAASFDATFTYDASGLRRSKSYNGSSIKYYWSGNRLLAERRIVPNSDTLYPSQNTYPSEHTFTSMSILDMSYIQGADGLAGFTVSVNGVPNGTYYYMKNIQGDVTHILDSDGDVKAEYVYDAWGNHTIVRDTDAGSGIGSIGFLNPFRYRGYYFDQETGLYYLKTRYYDPETGRFINADSLDVFDETSGDINGLNLYMYCGNNPVMKYDPTGQGFWGDLWDKTTKAVGDFFNGVGDGLAGFVDNTWYAITHPVETIQYLWNGLKTDPLGTIYHTFDFINPYEYYKAYQSGGWYGLGNHAGDSLATAIVIIATVGIGKIVKPFLPVRLKFTKHGYEQVMGRDGGHGVKKSAIRYTLKHPVEIIYQNNGSIKHLGVRSTVILNEKGYVITAWAKSRKFWRK